MDHKVNYTEYDPFIFQTSQLSSMSPNLNQTLVSGFWSRKDLYRRIAIDSRRPNLSGVHHVQARCILQPILSAHRSRIHLDVFDVSNHRPSSPTLIFAQHQTLSLTQNKERARQDTPDIGPCAKSYQTSSLPCLDADGLNSLENGRISGEPHYAMIRTGAGRSIKKRPNAVV